MCTSSLQEKFNIEDSSLKSQQRRFLCITSVMAASSSIVSNQSSLTRLFDKEMLHELYVMRDMVQEMYEDKKGENYTSRVVDFHEGGEEIIS